MKDIPFISIILPVYNSERFLKRCIESILLQDFIDFELIIINDGSTDSSEEICNNYAKKDYRIRLYNKQNEGVSSARNFGLSISRGEWVTFVDSDDYIDKSYIMNFISKIDTASILYVQQAMMLKNNCPTDWPYRMHEEVINLKDCKNHYLDCILFYGTPWGKLFNNKLIKQKKLNFDVNLNLHEDFCFFLEYIQYIKKIVVVSGKGYYYCINKGVTSLSRTLIIPPYKELLYAATKSQCIIENLIMIYSLKREIIPKTLTFIYSIKVRALRSIFFHSHSKYKRMKAIELFINDKNRKYYHPKSLGGGICKIILSTNNKRIIYFIMNILKMY